MKPLTTHTLTGQSTGPVEAVPFSALGVAAEICDTLESAGIRRAFPIQALALPIALRGHDIIGQARTGTGKTLAFGIPLVQRLRTDGDPVPLRPRGLVVVPTRELAIQVADDIRTVGDRLGIRVAVVYGGRAYDPQIAALRAGVDILVGTPGRLLDLVARCHLQLAATRMVVLDEADRMLDMGFLPDVERILRFTRDDRQTLLFSATMPDPIVTLARRHLRRPTHVRAETAEESAAVPNTRHHVFRTHHLDRLEVLARVLQAEDRGLTMVFCRTKRAAGRLADDLAARGFAAAAVHGDLGQDQRERALRAFRTGTVDVLVATDVAARGLDVDEVTHVVNYECPEDDTAYLHRIGRTGRAGRGGVAVTFVDWQDMGRWLLINNALGLGWPEPVETYSTSAHLFSELGIPREATGTLPRSLGDRAGRDREVGVTGDVSGTAAGRVRHVPGAVTRRLDSAVAPPRRVRRRTRGGRDVRRV